MTVRAVVLSDTHMPRRGRELPSQLLDALRQADIILHLGDFTGIEPVAMLEQFAPLYGVQGNNDSPEVRERFPVKAHVCVEGHELVLIHGHLGGKTALQAAREIREGDVVLFGHSHRAYCSEADGRFLFNPGSPTDRRWAPYRAFGILDIGTTIVHSVIQLP